MVTHKYFLLSDVATCEQSDYGCAGGSYTSHHIHHHSFIIFVVGVLVLYPS